MDNKDAEKARKQAYYQANKEKWASSRARQTDEQKARQREVTRIWRMNNKEKCKGYVENAKTDGRSKLYERRKNLKHKYGITVEDYENLKLSQNNCCAICQKSCVTGDRLSVDHCHANGHVRGLLCKKCNAALGLFMDSPELLRAAVQYIETQG